MSVVVNAEYKTFLKGIKERIHKAQYDAFKSVNKELINLYWDIGKSIVETLARDLQKEFPGIQGFSSANLWRMRNFYITYKENEKLAPLVREISWTKNVIIVERWSMPFTALRRRRLRLWKASMKLDQICFWSEIKLEIMKREQIYFSDKNRRLRLRRSSLR